VRLTSLQRHQMKSRIVSLVAKLCLLVEVVVGRVCAALCLGSSYSAVQNHQQATKVLKTALGTRATCCGSGCHKVGYCIVMLKASMP